MMKSSMSPTILVSALLLVPALGACSDLYYSTMESFGKEKRHIMVDRVEDARDDQEQAKEQFKTTLERLKELTNSDGGDLEAIYNRLSSDYDRSVSRADDVSDRIESIEDVAEDLFEEWEGEAEQITNASQRGESLRILADTKERYARMHGAMRRAEAKMAPVLEEFNNQVLFLKHNLNAKMIASLQENVLQIETDVSSLIAEMEASISEANEFIDGMST